MINVATRMSAAANETRKRFCGPLRERLVKTAMMTSMFPTMVKRIMRVIAVAKAAIASGEYEGDFMLSLEVEDKAAVVPLMFWSIPKVSWFGMIVVALPVKLLGSAILNSETF